MARSTVCVFHSKANMGPLSLLFTSSKRSSLFSYSLCGKQLTFIANERNTRSAQPRALTQPQCSYQSPNGIKGVACVQFQ